MLLYFRVHGSYEALVSGYSHDALVDFTGGIGEFIDLVKNPDKDRIYNFIKRVFKRNSMICCAIDVSERRVIFVGYFVVSVGTYCRILIY